MDGPHQAISCCQCKGGQRSLRSDPCPVQDQFQLLQTALNSLRLPATVTRCQQHRQQQSEGCDVTVVLMAEVEEVLNIFLEGSRLYPGAFLCVLTPTWLSHRPSTHHPGLHTLYVHQAVTADAGGQTYLDVFSPPRRVTHLDNLLFDHVTSRQGGNEGEELEGWSLETPTLSSLKLNARADDKLLTTIMCAETGVAHPVTLGLCLPGGYNHKYPRHHPSVNVIQLTSRDKDSPQLKESIKTFLDSDVVQRFEKVVVKPFGSTWNSCKGVTYHARSDVASVLRAVSDLLSLIEPGTGILVQSFHATFDPFVTPGLGRHAINIQDVPFAFRMRAIVVRTPDNAARMTQVVCGVAPSLSPIRGVMTISRSLPLTLRLWGVTDIRQQRRVHDSLRRSSETLMAELMRQEAELTAEERGGHGCQTDLIGIDFVLSRENSTITPIMIEVNGPDCLYDVSVYENMQPQERGKAVTPLVRTMIHRSQQFLMENKVVVVVGSGYYSKRDLLKDARQFGVKVILVDADPDHWAKHDVDTFLHVDFADHTQDQQHAETILAKLSALLPHGDHHRPLVDGCLTWWEDCVPLAALVAEGLNLHHCPSYRAALNAKSKARTQSVLLEQAGKMLHDLPLAIYASPVARVVRVEDVEEAVKKIPMPALLKLEFGSSAVAVRHVDNLTEAKQHVQHVLRALRGEPDHPGVGLGHGHSLILTPRLQGSEHDVDVVLFRGQLMAAFVSDNGPTRVPLCQETAATMPSVLCAEQQRQLMWSAASCCRGLGLDTGVFNVELMMTPYGPRLVEINARMGGFYLRHWIQLLYGADLLHLSLMCACGVPPALTGPSSLDGEGVGERVMGVMLYPSRHRRALATTASPDHLQRLHDQGQVVFCRFEPQVDQEDQSFEEPFANLAVRARSVGEARAKLVSVCASLGLETEDSLNDVLQDFVDL